MINNNYEKQFLTLASQFDAIITAGGKIVRLVDRIVQEDDTQASISLDKILRHVIETQHKPVCQIAQTLKEAMIFYYGSQKLDEICSSDKTSVLNDSKPLSELMADLNNLVGLSNVKAKVEELIAFQRVQLLRQKEGLSIPHSTLHLAFIGNPGTGKTTVARIVGRIYKQIGLLSKGHFTEVSRTDLIAGYQGQTALKVKKVIEKAKGGVLFIDEAYSITENENSDAYGRECLTELTKALEDYRQDLVVIVAGYTEPMKKFFKSNPGLKSRFNTFIEFEDYSSKELEEILQNMCLKDDYILSEGVTPTVNMIFTNIINKTNSEFSNGRFVRNFYEKMIMNQAKRVCNLKDTTINDLKVLKVEDLPIECEELLS